MDQLAIAPPEFAVADPLLLAAGLCLLLAGWFLLRLSLSLLGGCLGVGSCLLLHAATTARWLAPPWDLVAGGAWALGGLAAGVLTFTLLRLTGFFTIGLIVGIAGWVVVGHHVPTREGIDPDLVYAMGFPIAGGILGLLFMFGERWIVVLGSSLLGAILVMEGLGWPAGPLPLIPLAAVGAVLQLWLTGPAREENEAEDAK